MVVELREGGVWRVYISESGLCSVFFSGIVSERLDQLLTVSRNAFNFLGVVEIEKTLGLISLLHVSFIFHISCFFYTPLFVKVLQLI